MLRLALLYTVGVIADRRGFLGISLGDVVNVGSSIIGGNDEPQGCVPGGPQEFTRGLIRDAYADMAKGGPVRLLSHAPSLARVQSVADGTNEEAFDCPALQQEASQLLADISRFQLYGGSGTNRATIEGDGQAGRIANPGGFGLIPAQPTTAAGAFSLPLIGQVNPIVGLAGIGLIAFGLSKALR